MNNALKLKIGVVCAAVLFSIMTILPSFYKDMPGWWKTYLAPRGMQLGLDLQGGMHLVLRADLDKALKNSLELSSTDMKDALADKNIHAVQMDSPDPEQIILTLPNTGAVDTVNQVKDGFPNLDVQVEAAEGSFPRIMLRLTEKEADFIRTNAVAQSLEIIRNRIDQFGVAEPVIVRQGEDEIVVQLPGVKDPKRAIDLIGRTAQLEFKMVAEDAGLDLRKLIEQAIAAGQWKEGGSVRQLNLALQSSLPKSTEIAFERVVDDQTRRESKVPMLLESRVMMTGEMVKNARVGYGGTFNEPVVSLELTSRGGRIFGEITEKNVNKRFAIILDGVVRSAPVIREKILGGSAQISGRFTTEEAADLAIVLRAGALPAPVEIIQNMTVGASLGRDSIRQSLIAGLSGAGLVVLFMMVYYRFSGVIANFALSLNIIFLFAGLAMFGTTLTLPGIAGIILTVGMAVDSNVLIYERIREEFALGKSARSAVDAGFEHALSSIVDSQVTTLITALVLFLFGTGPIKGFAVTLSLGLIFNLFTALFCTRLVYDWLHIKRRLRDPKFLHIFQNPNFNFMGVRKIAFTISAVLVLLGLVAFVQILRGHANIGVDFSGGSLFQYKAEQSFQLDAVRAALTKGGYDSADLQQVSGENRLMVKIKKSEATVSNLADQITAVLNKDAGGKFTLESKSEIGASVSNVLRKEAAIAIILSMFGILLYLGFRFNFTFAVAAAVATYHDVLAVLGICWLLNMEISLLLITALLTLAGYSLNDTVVTFDRIRENLGKMHEKNLFEIINVSINDTLGRSVITALTVFFTLVTLYFFGGSTIHIFSFALLIGVLIGTYSSVFVASPLLTLKKQQTV